MERLDFIFSQNPGLREANEKKERQSATGLNQSSFRTQAIVYVPVVVHIVLPNPFVVTDADVQGQINRLNLDFAGLNPDSTNVPAVFAALRGHSQIQFCLARRTPGGLLTNGVERRASNAGSNVNVATDPIKRTSLGGLDVWDATQYLNLWVGTDVSGQGILGYAQFPGSGPAADDGVFLNYQSFGESTCSNIAIYNKGRTGSHEVGHYFGLYHIWGDDATATPCVGDDFRQLPAGSCTLPAGLFNPAGQGNTGADIGDTPNQAGATTNCPTGTATDACATAAPGKMYQNFMDYTADNCYSMFTIKQVSRMEWVLDNCRAGLKSSLACQLPAGAILLDAAPVASVNPGGFEQIGCAFTNYPSTLSCPGNLAPKFRIVNNGATAITSLTVGYRYDNGTAVTQNIIVTIPSGGTYVHSFSSTVTTTVGGHTLKFFTANPNGSADQVPANDTLTQALSVAAPVQGPISEGFESTTFPPANWTLNNPNGDFTWQRTTPGRGTSLGKASINNYDNDADGTIDEIRSPVISVTPGTSYSVSYDIAHKYYPAAVNYDALTILVSGDCGQTYTQLYQAAGPTLATAGFSQNSYAIPAAADWVTRFVTIPASIVAGGQVQIVFRNTNHYGNWIHLDNINISSAPPRDLRLVSINSPGVNVCSPAITPVVTVSNDGLEAITSFKIGYNINGGANLFQSFTTTLAPGASANFTLPAGTAPVGADVIKAFTADPVSATGTGDGRLANDTATKAFTVFPLTTLPLVEGFETAFPPIGWTIINPNADVTWIRRTPGRASTYSAFIDNFTNNVAGRVDDMKPPFLNIAGAADSVIISFDVAHKNYPGSNDLLQIGASPDCGNTYTAVYSKSGTALATNGPLSTAYLNPVATDWRRERISLNRTFLTTSGSLGLLIRNTSAFGNNIFIDNINISSLFKRDLQLISINGVSDLICGNSVTPSITVRNLGYETVTSFKIAYTLNGGSVQTQTFTGVSIPRDGQITVTLTTISLPAAGGYTLRLYSLDPVTVSGTGDLNPLNDSLNRVFSVPGITNAPLTESFVGTTFPPSGWSITNPDGAITWSRNPTGNGNAGSAYINTFRYSTTGQFDDLVTPIINYGAVDSVRFSFDLSAATRNYPGSAVTPIDTLSVLVSKDCGNTFTTVYQKWGADLQTLNDPNTPQAAEFFPLSPGQWRKENINLSQFASGGPLLVFFRASNNFENNVFIDNVNLTTQTLPSQLKQQGYIVYPTAFNNSFGVWFYQTPTNLKFMNVYNSAGQLVWSKKMNGSTDRQMRVDLTGMAAGVYLFEIGYNDPSRNVTQKVVKY